MVWVGSGFVKVVRCVKGVGEERGGWEEGRKEGMKRGFFFFFFFSFFFFFFFFFFFPLLLFLLLRNNKKREKSEFQEGSKAGTAFT